MIYKTKIGGLNGSTVLHFAAWGRSLGVFRTGTRQRSSGGVWDGLWGLGWSIS